MNQQALRVGIVTPRYPPAIGGVERHVEALAIGLVQSGLKVEVVTTDPTGNLPLFEERAGVLVRRFPTLNRDAVYFVAPQLGWWLFRHAAQYDVLHAHSYHTPLALQAAIASWANRIPFIVTPHYHGTGHSWLRRALHLPYRPFGHWLLRRARAVICVSEVEHRLIQQHFGTHVACVTIPNGVDVAAFLNADPRFKKCGQTLVLAAGRLEPYKQFDRIVEALPHLPPDFSLTIIGDGVARAVLEGSARKLAIGERLHMPGHVSQADLAAWFRSADVFVNLSRHEAFGLTLLESSVAGIPIVASDIPAHREVAAYLPAGRVLFAPVNCSPVSLAHIIQSAVSNGRSIDMTGWPLPTWAAMVESVVGLYRDAVRNNKLTPMNEVRAI